MDGQFGQRRGSPGDERQFNAYVYFDIHQNFGGGVEYTGRDDEYTFNAASPSIRGDTSMTTLAGRVTSSYAGGMQLGFWQYEVPATSPSTV